MLDGAAKVKPLFAEAERLGMPAVGMTDHGNMYGSFEFYQQAKATGIKPIIGIEAYLAPESRFHKQPVFWGTASQRGMDEFGEGGDVSGGGAYTHMTMLAENAIGLRNLFRLSSLASMQGKYRQPRMDKELVAEHAEGIIATTGCPSGEVQTRLRLGQADLALKAAADYRDIFGADNFFLELMDHGLRLEKSVRAGLLEIGRTLGLKPLATNDSHYVTKDQAQSHEALLCVQTGKTLSDPSRFKLDGDGYYLKSADEMRAIWDSELPDAISNTLLIAERVQSYEDVFTFTDRMPRVPLPPGETAESLLRKEIEEFIPTRFPDGLKPEYRERLEMELGLITQMGFAPYFLVVGDLVRWAKSQNIRVGPGRGSATGSLVAYLLQITGLDPIEHTLIFERFINPERITPPDIDLDFDDRRRGEVLRYTVDKYGAENVAQVITFGTIKTKAAIKDAARVLYGQPGFAMADKISKALPPPIMAKDIPLSGIVDPQHGRYGEATEVRTLVETDPDSGKIFETARGLEGLIRNAGVHACAVILSSQPLLDVVPLWQRDDGSVITGWDYPSCESVGLLKMDFLGLSNNTIISDAVDNVKANRGIDIDLDTLALDDRPTYELLASGECLGLFQLDGAGMRALMRRIAPTKFEDLSAGIALYRPGPMDAGTHNAYADRNNSREQVTPIHPELKDALEPILGESYHLVVYQEQVMAIAQRLAGYSLGGADILRRAMGKKKKEVLDAEYEKFRDGMSTNGYSAEATEAVWNVLVPFAGYGFNKSHSAGYAIVAYWTAYLKANYPAEFMAALLTSNGDNKDKMALYLGECRRMGIKVLPPDVNESAHNFTPVGTDIRFGLGAIRNVGANVVRSIVETREQKGRYTSFVDFLQKSEVVVCNKRTIESLIKAGAFDSLGHTRLGLCQQHDIAVDMVIGTKRKEAEGQFDLFGGMDDDAGDSVPLGLDLAFSVEEWDRKQLLANERDMLGLYVSSHPLAGAERILRKNSDCQIASLTVDEKEEGAMVTVAGMISGLQRRITKNGDPWAIATVEDLDASVEVLFFPKSYVDVAADLAEDSAVAIRGRVSKRDGTASLIGMELLTIDISGIGLDTDEVPLVVGVQLDKVTPTLVENLRHTLRAHPGQIPIQLKLRGPARSLLLAIDDDFRVEPSTAFMGEIKELLGSGCLE
jgi:DNA polymerase-3 subunit alpha